MVIDDAIKTTGRIFTFDEDPRSGFVSDGTWWPPSFDFAEETFLDHGSLDWAVEEVADGNMDKKFIEITEYNELSKKLIKFLFGAEGGYIYHRGSEEITIP